MNQPQVENTTEPLEKPPLMQGNWFPGHLASIEQLAEISSIPSGARPVAVFDFDNTCIFRDIGQAAFRFQAYELRYKIPPKSLASILPETGTMLDGTPIDLVNEQLTGLYTALWPDISTGNYDKARRRKEALFFTTLLLWFVEKARKDKQLGPRFVLPFLAKLFCGFSEDDVKTLAKDTIAIVGSEELVTRKVELEFPQPLRMIKTSFEMGMRAFEEMRVLQQWLTSHGIQCCVISASADLLVQAAVQIFDFPVSPENIYGIRVAKDSGGVLTNKEMENYPVTFREGKVAVIREYINGVPVCIAGDADTDYEMLTLPDIPVRIIINRNQQGLIKTLYADPAYLLQGINFSQGRFRPFRESI